MDANAGDDRAPVYYQMFRGCIGGRMSVIDPERNLATVGFAEGKMRYRSGLAEKSPARSFGIKHSVLSSAVRHLHLPLMLNRRIAAHVFAAGAIAGLISLARIATVEVI